MTEKDRNGQRVEYFSHVEIKGGTRAIGFNKCTNRSSNHVIESDAHTKATDQTFTRETDTCIRARDMFKGIRLLIRFWANTLAWYLVCTVRTTATTLAYYSSRVLSSF
jgi:hypothetical protein